MLVSYIAKEPQRSFGTVFLFCIDIPFKQLYLLFLALLQQHKTIAYPKECQLIGCERLLLIYVSNMTKFVMGACVKVCWLCSRGPI